MLKRSLRSMTIWIRTARFVDEMKTHQAAKYDGEEVQIDSRVREAPQRERGDPTPNSTGDHDLRIGEPVRQVSHNDLSKGSRSVEECKDNGSCELVGDVPREQRDVKGDWEVGKALQKVCGDLSMAISQHMLLRRGHGLTKLQNSGLLIISKFGGMNRGRR